jgi:hypothetical protein
VKTVRATKKARPWDPDAARRGVGMLVVGGVFSVVLHGVIPLSGVYWRPQSITQLPVTMVIESIPLPPADELVEAPDSPDDVVNDVDDEPTPKQTDDEPTLEPVPKPAEKAVEEDAENAAEEDAETPPQEAPAPPPSAAKEEAPSPSATPTTTPDLAADELAARMAERDRQRAQWLAERDKRRAEREARREARRRAADEARRRAGAPEAGETHGETEAVYLCTATDKGEQLTVRTERPLTSWMPIVPTVFAHFQTRPGLDGWLRKTSQVYVPRKRVGLMDLASPTEVMQFALEEPRGVTIAVGRLDARCLVGLTYRPKLFPLKLSRVPARILDRQNNSVAALVNITIFKDATLELEPFDARQPALPFKRGALQNSKAIARNIEDHYQAVRLANQFAELFGLKQKKDASTRSSSTKAPSSSPSASSSSPSSSPTTTSTPTDKKTGTKPGNQSGNQSGNKPTVRR